MIIAFEQGRLAGYWGENAPADPEGFTGWCFGLGDAALGSVPPRMRLFPTVDPVDVEISIRYQVVAQIEKWREARAKRAEDEGKS